MTSVVDVCNKALDKLGQSPITSLNDGTKAANLCNRGWELVRDEVLRDHPWNFAVKRKILSPSTEAPAWGFTYQSPIPNDCLRLIEIRDLSTGEYQIEDNQILSNEAALYIRYISRITDPVRYDALFIDAVATRMALELCEAFTQSNAKKNIFFSEYQESLNRARRVDGQENPPAVFETDEWLEVRY